MAAKKNHYKPAQPLNFFQDPHLEAASLWQQVTQNITPLSGSRSGNALDGFGKPPADHRDLAISNKALSHAPTKSNNSPKMQQKINKHYSPVLVHGDGLDINRLQKVKKRKININARLDLHGMDQQTAYAKLYHFLSHHYVLHHRILLIITGKGSGILQNAVPSWLNLPHIRKLIVGFEYATPQDGGSGAIYVFLKKAHPL
ncbi:MAG: Smr/MutS family protein [Alphaproteobacteria bacterium]